MRRTISLVARMVSGALAAIACARSRTVLSISPGCVMRVTRPSEAASVASRSRPVKSRSFVRAGPTRSTSLARFAAERQLPSVRAMGTPNCAVGVHTRRSQVSAIAQPPPAATPCTCAMVGTDTRSRRSMTASSLRSYAIPSSPEANPVNWRMSVPAAKASPAPRTTNTRTVSSASARSQASTSASYIAQVRALRASGRLNVRNAIEPMDSYRASEVDTGETSLE
jgi:hypothetical protein